jgi:hypothetical protein
MVFLSVPFQQKMLLTIITSDPGAKINSQKGYKLLLLQAAIYILKPRVDFLIS